jgi:hypothetical protein
MTIPGMEEINNDALLLREKIDSVWEQIADDQGEGNADEQTKPLYNAVTRLHELAASAVRANQVKGIGS